jgi:hypothetical protein
VATSGELADFNEHSRALYRLWGLTSSDDALTEQGEASGDLIALYLTRGYRTTQRWAVDQGHAQSRWRKRSSAITSWPGTDAADGGRYVNLATGSGAIATDFLRLDGDQKTRSALVQANGDAWGSEIEADQDFAKGNYYYLKDDQLWLARGASPPSTLYLRYYYQHPAITSATTSFDMPVDARWLCVCEAAIAGTLDGWGVDGAVLRIETARKLAREEARRVLRRTREPRKFRMPQMYGTRW